MTVFIITIATKIGCNVHHTCFDKEEDAIKEMHSMARNTAEKSNGRLKYIDNPTKDPLEDVLVSGGVVMERFAVRELEVK